MPPWMAAHVLGLVVRDAPQAALLTMRVYYCAAKQDFILRSQPKAGVSKDGPQGVFFQMLPLKGGRLGWGSTTDAAARGEA